MSMLLECSMGELNAERKPLFPLFQKTSQPSNHFTTEDSVPAETDILLKLNDDRHKGSASQNGKIKKAAGMQGQPSLFKDTIKDAEQADSLDIDPNGRRRKRRKQDQSTYGSNDKLVEQNSKQEDLALCENRGQRLGSGLVTAACSADKERTIDNTFQQSGFPLSNSSTSACTLQPVLVSAENQHTQSRTSGPRMATAEPRSQTPNTIYEHHAPCLSSLMMQSVASSSEEILPENHEPEQCLTQGPTHGSDVDSSQLKAIQTPTTKQLRYNPRTGTIGSPPKKQVSPPERLPHKRLSKNKSKSKVVKLCYGHATLSSPNNHISRFDDALTKNVSSSQAVLVPNPTGNIHLRGREYPTVGDGTTSSLRPNRRAIGQRIDRILNNEERIYPIGVVDGEPSTACLVKRPNLVINYSPVNPAKPVHPLFLGKPAILQDTQKVAKREPFQDLATDSAPRTSNRRRRANGDRSSSRGCEVPSQIGGSAARTAFVSSNKASAILRYPGALEPAWPWRDLVHLHGYDLEESLSLDNYRCLEIAERPTSKSYKSKKVLVDISPDENFMVTLIQHLRVTDVAASLREVDLDEFPPIPTCLRVPQKIHEDGQSLQRRVRNHLRSPSLYAGLDSHSVEKDELHSTSKNVRPPLYPILSQLYARIATSRSAFDLGQCETQLWTQKYAPRTANAVLQAGPEAKILRSWLLGLTVNTVDSTAIGGSDVSSKPVPPKKRKRPSDRLDGFMVTSDDEIDELAEISETEDDHHNKTDTTRLAKTEMRPFSSSRKLKNTIVVSGSHGCGKSAAVYAVAKELGFEVFEINSASRRGGKDILEKVGSMTGNHQVQAVKPVSQLEGPSDDKNRIDAALANDLTTGRQGTMNSFFKTKSVTNTTTASESGAVPNKSSHVLSRNQIVLGKNLGKKPSTKEQKQSLILIEEADIVYKQDSSFWTTIQELQKISKRPIILTCNDESAIPLPQDSIDAYLRFHPAPVDIAVDYMLLVAACEGHVLGRGAVTSLYEEKRLDLRASITELNFWCQFGVGDIHRGLSWFYPRDRASKDDRNRVISRDTYYDGMGIFCQDIMDDHSARTFLEDQLFTQAYDYYRMDIGEWEETLNMSRWADSIAEWSTRKEDRQDILCMFSNYTESMSDADLLSGSLFAPETRDILDATQPEMTSLASEDYTLNYEVKDTPIMMQYSSTLRDLSFSVKSSARGLLQADCHSRGNIEHHEILDSPSKHHILQLIEKDISSPVLGITRYDFALAFDDISYSDDGLLHATRFDSSQFDRPRNVIALDLAPYVRGIVAYDGRLQKEREKISNLLSEGSRNGKRMRTTRSALSALEGGARSKTRRERYFPDLNAVLVMRTGLEEWSKAAVNIEREERSTLGLEEQASANG